MHKIYFENRCLVICSPDEATLNDPNAIIFRPGRLTGLQAFVNMLESSGALDHIYIPTEDIENVYADICTEFRQVNAGGGLVRNRRGDYLLISRNGLWDLPKGHQDPGEDIRTTALREVEEETGIQNLIPGELICITDHCYFRNGVWHLKHTWWYDMLHNDPVDLTPQQEEDIVKAAWVAKSSLTPFLLNTYPSIVEVFREAKI